MKKIYIILSMILLIWIGGGLGQDSFAQKIDHVRAEAKTGDGIYSLLSRYQLSPTNDYIDHFCLLNKDKLKDKRLVAGEVYILPIRIYRYNGISIRSTIGINDRPRAERIQAYNRSVLNAGLQEKDYMESLVLWVPYHELDINAKKRTTQKLNRGRFPIFGAEHANVSFKDSQLQGCVYYIVAGHGGPDPGAVGKRDRHTLCEDEYAYDVALRLTRRLLEHGATAYVITRDPNDGIRSDAYLACDYDEYCWGNKTIPKSQLSRLKQRADVVNQLYYRHLGARCQRVVVIHVDSRSQRNRVDMFFYYHSKSRSSKALAQTLHQTINQKYQYHQPNRGYSGFVRARDELYMLRKTLPTSVYIELGNIRNQYDQIRFIKENNRQAVANWLCDGLIKDAN